MAGSLKAERAPGGDWASKGLVLEGPHISSMAIDAVRGRVYAGVHGGGVFFSADQGRGWEDRSQGIRVPHVFSVNCAVDSARPRE